MANSLANLQGGQKMLAVGVPLAAAQLWPRPAHAYSALPAARPARQETGLDLTLGQLSALVARIAGTLREELAIALRGIYLFLLFLPAVVTAPVCLLADAHRARWLELVRWTLEQAGAPRQGPASAAWIAAGSSAPRVLMPLQRAACSHPATPSHPRLPCRPRVHQVGAVGGHAARPLPCRRVRRAGGAADQGADARVGAHRGGSARRVWRQRGRPLRRV